MMDTLQSLSELLSESVEAAKRREAAAYDQIAGNFGDKMVLFGAGGLGRRTLSGLKAHGIKPLAFADNFPRAPNIDDVPVLQTADAAQRFGRDATFVVTIWGALGKDRMRDRIAQLHRLGCQRVTSFGRLYWKYPRGILPHYGADLPHHVHEQADAVRKCVDLWADEDSRLEYVKQIRWRLFMDFDCLSDPVAHATYFPRDICALRDDETFLDCGAYDGDTLRAFMEQTGGKFDRYFGFEPDPLTFPKLSAASNGDERITLWDTAVGSKTGRVRMEATGTPSSTVGSGDCEVTSITIDRLGVAASYLKMDIEGAELDAIEGARQTIREHKPVLTISCYHRQDHLWKVPLLIDSIAPGYSFFLRPHDIEMWDLVCYAIPEERLTFVRF